MFTHIGFELLGSALAVGGSETPLDQLAAFLTDSSPVSRFALQFLFVSFLGVSTLGLFPDWGSGAVRTARKSTGFSLVAGIPALIGFVFLIVLSMILSLSGIGALLGLPLLIVTLVFFAVWQAMGYMAVGGLIADRAGVDNVVAAALIGAGLSGLFAVIPYLGWVLALVVTLLGHGASVRTSFGGGTTEDAERNVPDKHQFTR